MRLGYQSTLREGQLYFGGEAKHRHQRCRIEWATGKKSYSCGAKICLFTGDSDNDLTLSFNLPWLISVYFSICGVFKPCKYKERFLGFSFHHEAFWIYLLPYANESSSQDPWYRKTYSWYFPWALDWYKTEILTHDTPQNARPYYTETRGKRSLSDWKRREEMAQQESTTYEYRYTLKSGSVQERLATVYVERMEWRARWYPIIWRRKVRTSIDVKFNGEVGEQTGSWKGGTIGSGYEMLPGETPEQTLRRMERERKFN